MSWGPQWYEQPDGWAVGIDREAGYMRQGVVMKLLRRFPSGTVEQYGPGGQVWRHTEENRDMGAALGLGAEYDWLIPAGAEEAIIKALRGETRPDDGRITERLLSTLESTLSREQGRVDKLVDFAITPATAFVTEELRPRRD